MKAKQLDFKDGKTLHDVTLCAEVHLPNIISIIHEPYLLCVYTIYKRSNGVFNVSFRAGAETYKFVTINNKTRFILDAIQIAQDHFQQVWESITCTD